MRFQRCSVAISELDDNTSRLMSTSALTATPDFFLNWISRKNTVVERDYDDSHLKLLSQGLTNFCDVGAAHKVAAEREKVAASAKAGDGPQMVLHLVQPFQTNASCTRTV